MVKTPVMDRKGLLKSWDKKIDEALKGKQRNIEKFLEVLISNKSEERKEKAFHDFIENDKKWNNLLKYSVKSRRDVISAMKRA